MKNWSHLNLTQMVNEGSELHGRVGMIFIILSVQKVQRF